ncbi:MAG: ketopantoate reductase family protein, partial [Thermoleophilaceae bacterium]
MTSLAILGPGGVGAFLGAALARAGRDVVLIAREPTADAINRDALEVDSACLGPVRAHPAAATTLSTPA